MLNIETRDENFIKTNFETMELYFSYCLDYHLYSKEQTGMAQAKINLNPYTSKGIDGVTTGIVIGVEDYEEEGLIITIFAEGCHRPVCVDDSTLIQLLEVQASIDNYDVWTPEEISSFQFIVNKPFILYANDGEVTLIRPLDPQYYENNRTIEMLQTFDSAESFE